MTLPSVDPDAPTDAEDPDTPADTDTPSDETEDTAPTKDTKTEKSDSSRGPWLWIGLSVGGVLLIGGGVTAYLLWRKKRSAANTTEE